MVTCFIVVRMTTILTFPKSISFFYVGCRNDETIVEKAMENDLQSIEELLHAGVCVDSKDSE